MSRALFKISLYLVLVFFSLFPTAGISGNKISTLSLSTEFTSLLDGRLLVRLPSGIMVGPVQEGLMSPRISLREQTEVFVGVDDETLVLLATETFSRAGKKFANTIQLKVEWLDENSDVGPFNLEQKQDSTGMSAFYITPSKLDTSTEGALVERAYIINSDRMVQLLEIYVNAVAARDVQGSKKIAHQILETLVPGPRQLDFGAGPQRFAIYSKERELQLVFPEGFITTTDEGPDFLVHRVRKVSDFGESYSGFGMYVGDHPRYHYTHEDTSMIAMNKIQGKFLEENIEWYVYERSNEKGVKRMETICPLRQIDEELYIHIFSHTPTDSTFEEIREMLTTASLAAK